MTDTDIVTKLAEEAWTYCRSCDDHDKALWKNGFAQGYLLGELNMRERMGGENQDTITTPATIKSK